MSDKTYAETQGAAPFDWNAFLDRAEREEITTDEFLYAADLAEDFATCAVGNQCAIIPRGRKESTHPQAQFMAHAPVDDELFDLGCAFYADIQLRDWSKSREVLKKIEARSVALIEKELAKRNAK